MLGLFCSLGVTVSLLAQNHEEANKVRFRTMGWGANVEGLYINQKNSDVPVVIQEDTRSEFISYSGKSLLSFYGLNKLADGTTEKVPFADVDISKAGPNPLVIFLPDDKAPNKYSVYTTPDDPINFPACSYKFINFSSYAASIKIKTESLTLNPGEEKLVRFKYSEDNPPIFASASINKNGEVLQIYGANWVMRENIHTMVFIMPNEDSSSGLTVRRFPESVEFPPDPEEKKTP